VLDARHVSVPRFVREALDLAGAEWEERPDAILEALLPGEPDLRRATLEPEVAREEQGVELLGQGSRLFETLVDLARGRSPVARGWASPAPVPPPALSAGYRLGAGRLTRTEWVERRWTTWIFAFLVRHVGEFRRDTLHLVGVDGASLRLVRRFEEIVSSLPLADAGPEPEADRPVGECVRAARREIVRRSQVGFNAALAEAAQDLEKEARRIRSYYDGLIREMSEDMEALAPEDPRRAAILSRVQATRPERERSLAQAEERYRLSIEVEVVGALGIVYPRRVATVTLEDARGKAAVPVEAAWDPVFGQYEPLVCPGCRNPTYALELAGRSASCGCR